jgi:hypothetical protein
MQSLGGFEFETPVLESILQTLIISQVKEAEAANVPAPPKAAEDNSRLFAGGNAAFQDFSANAGQAAARTAAIEEEVTKNIGEQSQA